MDRTDRIRNLEKKIRQLELELNDLRQGLVVVQDFCRELERALPDRSATLRLEHHLVRPLIDEDNEFSAIWRFHAERLVPDPLAHVPYAEMYEAFVRYCTGTGREVLEQEVFEFVLARTEEPPILADRGEWKGCRLIPERG